MRVFAIVLGICAAVAGVMLFVYATTTPGLQVGAAFAGGWCIGSGLGTAYLSARR